MSRTALCLLTAAGLAILSVGAMIGRYYILGDEVKVPTGPGTWKVTLLVRGRSLGYDARLTTAIPLDVGRQRVLRETSRSDQFLPKPPDVKHPERHQILWSQRPAVGDGPFRAVFQFYCSVSGDPARAMSKLARSVYAAPPQETYPAGETRIESDHLEISELARRLTVARPSAADQLPALFEYVAQQIGNEPTVEGTGLSALECLHNGSGDSWAKSRLFVALCRNRGIPARLVIGLALREGHEQNAHVWAEAWVHDHWTPACTFYHHFGRVPASYLVFHYGDVPLVRGKNIRDLTYAFFVERPGPAEDLDGDTAGGNPAARWLRHVLARLSLFALPPTEQRLVEFLLLLPIAALIVCVCRNVIGINSFGTFAPALVGLAFRDLGGLPGILVFVSIVLIGWMLRRVLDYYHLLQVPRMALLLSLVVIVLIGLIVAANFHDLPATKYISLFPMVILTGMIERFWTLEVEDGTSSSFRTLLGTLLIAASISLLLSLHAVVRHMFRFPETLGLIMAAQLLIGRYTGYRLSELLRFRELITSP
jgi:hypothetical protein